MVTCGVRLFIKTTAANFFTFGSLLSTNMKNEADVAYAGTHIISRIVQVKQRNEHL